MARKYNPERLNWLFSEVLKTFGPYDRRTWHTLPAPTKGYPLSGKEIEEQLRNIYERFVKKFDADGLELPDSYEALEQQVQWATTFQGGVRKGGHLEDRLRMQRRNRLAAYRAGFMSMGDIIYLERLAKRKSPVVEETQTVVPTIPAYY